MLKLFILLVSLIIPVRSIFWTTTSAPSEDWYSIASDSKGQYLAAVNSYGGLGSIYTSSDGGSVWVATSAPDGNWASIASDTSGQFLAAVQNYGGYIFTSSDGGSSWEQTIAPLGNWNGIASNSTGQFLAAVTCTNAQGSGSSQQIFVSSNRGSTWTLTSAPAQWWNGITADSSGQFLAAVGYAGGYIFTSTDWGSSWTMADAPSVNWYSIASDSIGQYLVACVGNNGPLGYIYTSSNGGLNWTQTNSTAGYYASVTSDSTGQFLAAAMYGYIYVSSNWGFDWSATLFYANWRSVVSDSTGSFLAAVVYGGDIYTTISSPSSEPTISPSSQPTTSPSSQPTTSPSSQPTSRPPGIIFHYTGDVQKYLVPSTPGIVFVQLWGAGGAGSTYQNTASKSGYGGGAGGYTECVLNVNPGDYLDIIVAGGGQSASGNGPNGPGGWPDGGSGSGGGAYNPGWNGAGGGGRSAVRLNGTTSDLVTAGGGGAGGTWIYWSSQYCTGAQQYNNGGGGGGLTAPSSAVSLGGNGGTQTVGGNGGSGSSGTGQAGYQYGGGNGGGGAGGGGGYFGGGGGGQSGCTIGGGGGGSSFVGGCLSGQLLLTGQSGGADPNDDDSLPGAYPPYMNDSFYFSSVGIGGLGEYSGNGGNGLVVISFTSLPTAAPTFVPCPDGTFFSSGVCEICPKGSFSSGPASTACTLCPINTFSDVEGSSECTPCPQNKLTPTVGSNSQSVCIRPVTNFAFGAIMILLSSILSIVYIVLSRFHNISYLRRARLVEPLYLVSQDVLRHCEDIKKSILRHTINKQNLAKSESTSLELDTKFRRLSKCALFIITSIITTFTMMIVLLLLYFGKSLYTSFILFRGFRFNVTIDLEFIVILDNYINQVASLIHIRGFDIFLRRLYYPWTYILDKLSTLTFLSFQNIGVTCSGSLSSSQLLFNCIMVGLLVVIIESNYHLLISLPIQRIYKSLIQVLGFPKCRSILGWDKVSFYSFFFEVLVSDMFTNLQFMIYFLTYLLGFTSVSSFFWFHKWTPSCNDVGGAVGIDASYAVLNTVITYILVFPVTYTVLYILVPGYPKNAIDVPYIGALFTIDLFRNKEKAIYGIRANAVPQTMKDIFQMIKLYGSVDVWLFYKFAYGNMKYMDEKIKMILRSRTSDRDSRISATINPIFSSHSGSLTTGASDNTISMRSSCSFEVSKVCMDKISEKELLEYSSNHTPNYYTLSVWVYSELTHKYQSENNIQKSLLSILSFTIVGHLMTDIGRYSWLVSFWKIFILLTVSFGYWNDSLMDVFRQDSTTDNIIKHIKNSDEFGALLQGLLVIRSILFQLIPPFTFLSLYVQATSSCPIFVSRSSKVASLLPPLIPSWENARKMAIQEELLPQKWVLFLLSMHFFVCGGRLVRYIVGVLKLIVAMSVIFLSISGSDSSIESIGLVIAVSSVIIVPYSFFYSLKFLVLIGKSPLFDMEDSDFKDLSFIAEIIYAYFGTPDYHKDDDIDKDDMKDVDNRITLTQGIDCHRVDDRFSANRLDYSIRTNRIDDYNSDTSNNIVTNIIHKSNKWIEKNVDSSHHHQQQQQSDSASKIVSNNEQTYSTKRDDVSAGPNNTIRYV